MAHVAVVAALVETVGSGARWGHMRVDTNLRCKTPWHLERMNLIHAEFPNKRT